eukprot:TRINITY_DN18997_c0_g1_i1.p1 TRINITY_DN18997_c0_g1~~TRINITY_DN18997_c0_g1_i1.p1  ORF type:complete len:1343 (+),score=376.27 TRINITY_DN18997_c0_g1_i1:512-4030(+)
MGKRELLLLGDHATRHTAMIRSGAEVVSLSVFMLRWLLSCASTVFHLWRLCARSKMRQQKDSWLARQRRSAAERKREEEEDRLAAVASACLHAPRIQIRAAAPERGERGVEELLRPLDASYFAAARSLHLSDVRVPRVALQSVREIELPAPTSQDRAKAGALGQGDGVSCLGLLLAGCVVCGVRDRSPAALAGLVPGDRIMCVGQAVIRSEEDLRDALAPAAEGHAVTLVAASGSAVHIESLVLQCAEIDVSVFEAVRVLIAEDCPSLRVTHIAAVSGSLERLSLRRCHLEYAEAFLQQPRPGVPWVPQDADLRPGGPYVRLPPPRRPWQPMELRAWGRLRFLDLSDNRIEELPPSIAVLSELEELVIDRNRLTRLDHIEKLTRLVRLSAQKNDLRGVASLARCQSILHINLEYNAISEFPWEYLFAVRSVRLAGNRIASWDGLRHFAENCCLGSDFRPSSSSMLIPSPSSLGDPAPHLEDLTLAGNPIERSCGASTECYHDVVRVLFAGVLEHGDLSLDGAPLAVPTRQTVARARQYQPSLFTDLSASNQNMAPTVIDFRGVPPTKRVRRRVVVKRVVRRVRTGPGTPDTGTAAAQAAPEQQPSPFSRPVAEPPAAAGTAAAVYELVPAAAAAAQPDTEPVQQNGVGSAHQRAAALAAEQPSSLGVPGGAHASDSSRAAARPAAQPPCEEKPPDEEAPRLPVVAQIPAAAPVAPPPRVPEPPEAVAAGWARGQRDSLRLPAAPPLSPPLQPAAPSSGAAGCPTSGIADTIRSGSGWEEDVEWEAYDMVDTAEVLDWERDASQANFEEIVPAPPKFRPLARSALGRAAREVAQQPGPLGWVARWYSSHWASLEPRRYDCVQKAIVVLCHLQLAITVPFCILWYTTQSAPVDNPTEAEADADVRIRIYLSAIACVTQLFQTYFGVTAVFYENFILLVVFNLVNASSAAQYGMNLGLYFRSHAHKLSSTNDLSLLVPAALEAGFTVVYCVLAAICGPHFTRLVFYRVGGLPHLVGAYRRAQAFTALVKLDCLYALICLVGAGSWYVNDWYWYLPCYAAGAGIAAGHLLGTHWALLEKRRLLIAWVVYLVLLLSAQVLLLVAGAFERVDAEDQKGLDYAWWSLAYAVVAGAVLRCLTVIGLAVVWCDFGKGLKEALRQSPGTQGLENDRAWQVGL